MCETETGQQVAQVLDDGDDDNDIVMLSGNRARIKVDVRGGWRKLHSEELYDF
jgi:hypothetical protein